MEISSIAQVFEHIKRLDSLQHENLATVKTGNYFPLSYVTSHFDVDLEKVGDALDLLGINEEGLCPNGIIMQANRMGLKIEKINRQVYQFDYVLRAEKFDIFFGS